MGELASATTTALPDGGPDLVLVPLGATEQHGPHLPLGTDTMLAEAVSRQVASRLGGAPGVLVAPALPYGSSGEHQSFAGTVSIGTPALVTVIVELGRSMTTWARRIVLVNGHGGNLDALRQAVPLLREEGRDVAWVPCPVGRDAHAGLGETAALLHLAPALVDEAAIEPGATGALADLLPAMQAGGVAAVAPNGILGDPTSAGAAEGERVLEAAVTRVLWAVRDAAAGEHGLLRLTGAS